MSKKDHGLSLGKFQNNPSGKQFKSGLKDTIITSLRVALASFSLNHFKPTFSGGIKRENCSESSLSQIFTIQHNLI